ncbi:hypothetical protein [Orenia marismortui]|uniref:Uncharacterized protein n=1 Tax=Orenia marismortui TaxID=46469 RepID=A0A4R8GZI0_9FIRM|nr:hypothetical protein [Orenia marismortui]TDX52171.1 hypothetical protein C7959_10893 [Orenia marismortui]
MDLEKLENQIKEYEKVLLPLIKDCFIEAIEKFKKDNPDNPQATITSRFAMLNSNLSIKLALLINSDIDLTELSDEEKEQISKLIKKDLLGV